MTLRYLGNGNNSWPTGGISNSGNDVIYGEGGNDRINGGWGDDKLNGGPGNDLLYGGVGDDKLYGGSGNDVLDGALGSDTLDGGPGQDTLIGGDVVALEFDTMIGGDGRDTFQFIMDGRGGTHLIKDFNSNFFVFSNADSIDLSKMLGAFKWLGRIDGQEILRDGEFGFYYSENSSFGLPAGTHIIGNNTSTYGYSNVDIVLDGNYNVTSEYFRAGSFT